MKKKKEILFLVLFIAVLSVALLYLFQSSYAKYRRNTEATVNGRIASWDIKINNESISSQTTLTNTITPVIEDSTYVKSGTIAPGSTGYFDLTIDATNVDVDFTYTITSEVAEETPLLDLKLTGYKINNGSKVAYDEATGITGNIPMNTSSTELRIYFEWDDSATNTMDNQADTEYAQDSSHQNTDIKVTINLQQKR